MARIAIIIADLFEDSEYLQPAVAFQKAGHEILHVGLQAGATVKGKKKGTSVLIDSSFKEVGIADFDALLIPGGYSPDKLRADERAVAFVKDFMEAKKPVFSICHGPQILITAKVIEGRHITGWKSIVQDIVYAGGIFHDREVVVDGNLVSSRSPADLTAFISAALKKLG
ncbi:MAG: type 1 glutamine amidotransferase [Desulfobulbaceae bacterium]|nr:type 1 glutamine amidotransferase [Desulfobulbaceae bacterium]